MTHERRPLALAVLATTCVLAAGCDDRRRPTIARVPDGCERAAPRGAAEPVPGLLAPRAPLVAGAPVGSAQTAGVTIVSGFVALTPAQFVRHYDQRRDLRVLFSEDEGFEAEVQVTDGRYGNFWKVVRVCPQGSRFTATVGVSGS